MDTQRRRPPSRSAKTRVALLGWGGIASDLVELSTVAGGEERFHVVAALVRPLSTRAVAPELSQIPLVTTIDELLLRGPDIVAEVASQDAVLTMGEPVLAAGIDLLVVSAGALCDDALRDRLLSTAAASGARIFVPAGAIGGIDILSAHRLAGGLDVTYRSTKPVGAWRGTAAEQMIDLDDVTAPVVFFRGSAREAALTFPQNANVAATVALAGAGFDATRVELAADPATATNNHVLEARSSAGSFLIRIESIPSASNPRTSALTALSVAHALVRRSARIAI